jgi:hypothetical protein
MDFIPPVTSVPGLKSTYTRVQKTGATSDKTVGFPNRIDSTVKKVRQGYDEKKNEHVIYLEYRARVKPGAAGSENPQVLALLRDLVSGRS